MVGAAAGKRLTHDSPALAHAKILAFDVSVLALLIALGAAGLAVADIWIPTALNGWIEWGAALCLFVMSTLILQFARLRIIWKSHVESEARPAETANFVELFVYLALGHVTLTAIVFLSTMPGMFGANAVNLSHTGSAEVDFVQVGILVAMFLASFAPLLFAFTLQALRSVRERKQKLFRDDVVSPISLLIMVSLFGGIALLAWAAAGEMFTMTSDFGVLVTGVVIVAFIVTILAPHIARYWNEQSEARDAVASFSKQSVVPAMAPWKWVSRADSVLVRLVAPLSGATQRRFPHVVLMAVMLPLSALGYVLASPFGLVPIAVGMLTVLALGRRWAWLEDDRETASRLQSTQGNDIHVGFENDLKDEALLGYAWLFILVPLALNQLQEWTHSFEAVQGASSGNAFVDWVRFFGAELAKAVPFVDWWEIYNVDVNTPFDAENAAPLAKHLTFISRALVDLVIMAALFQALGIWQRSRTQQRLYDTGQLDYFDPFTEMAFFETGMQGAGKSSPTPKSRFQKRIEAHIAARQALGRPPLPYNTHRLAELTKSDRLDVRAGAQWLIGQYGVLTGSPLEQLRQLRNRWLKFQIQLLTKQDSTNALSIIRNEKLEFERILASLKDAQAELNDDDVGALALLLNVVKGSPEFGYARDLAYQLLGQVASEMSVTVLALCVLEPPRHLEVTSFLSDDLAAMSLEVKTLFEGRADVRERVYEALAKIGINTQADLDARGRALNLLEWMAIPAKPNDGTTGDKAKSSCQAAREAAENVKASLAASSSA